MSVTSYDKTPGNNVSVGGGGEAVGIDEGMPRRDVNNAMRAMCADIAKDYADQGSIVSNGSNAALEITTSSTITTLRDGLRLTFKAHITVATGATLSVNGITGEALVVARSSGVSAVQAAEFLLGGFVSVVRDQGQWVILNPATLSEIVDNDDLTVSPTKAPTRANVAAAIAAASLAAANVRSPILVIPDLGSSYTVDGTNTQPDDENFRIIKDNIVLPAGAWNLRGSLVYNYTGSVSQPDVTRCLVQFMVFETGTQNSVPGYIFNEDVFANFRPQSSGEQSQQQVEATVNLAADTAVDFVYRAYVISGDSGDDFLITPFNPILCTPVNVIDYDE